jgi:DNA processing protein
MMTKPSDDDRAARAALTFLAEPHDPVISALLTAATPMDVLDMLTTGRIADLSDAPMAGTVQRTFDRARARLADVPSPEQLRAWQREGIRIVCPGDLEWPEQLSDLGHQTPYALWVRGNADLRFSCLRSVSVVGSRAATAYGSYMAAELSSSVAARGWTVISGAAYGVDAAAHRGALSAEATTIAILACGVDKPYPVGHTELLDTVAATGSVVSEYPPGSNATRLRFLTRNRIIAALAPGKLVVEAGERSGALSTARHARDMGRVLMALPGPVTSAQSAGCHTIIRDWGGSLVTSAAQVLEDLALVDCATDHGSSETEEPGRANSPRGAGPDGEEMRTHEQPRPAFALGRIADEESAAVLDALPVRGWKDISTIASDAGVPVNTVRSRLDALSADGLAERHSSQLSWRIRRS